MGDQTQALLLLLRGLERFEHELLLFAAVWFAVGALDELLVDGLWLRLLVTGKARARRLPPREMPPAPLRGVIAVLVPAWHEAPVVGAMLAHCLKAWPQADLRIYAGCYRNDPATLAAMIAAAGTAPLARDDRLRIVVHAAHGPTTKADCLNRLYGAMCDDELRGGWRARAVLLHDAEDMVHPEALAAIDEALETADFVQVPVRPEPQPASRWVAGHYADEFAESHARAMVVRSWLGIGLPSAGVGSGFSRGVLDRLAARRGSNQPFAAECLTEDYECGLLIGELGARARFLRLRDAAGDLVATRAFFPASLAAAVRQKTRWLHGIAFQGWDRLGWTGSPAELWMRLRDRRGPMAAVVMAVAYLLIVLAPVLWLAEWAGWLAPAPVSGAIRALLWFNLANLAWRTAMRFLFTAREYGLAEGLLSVLRVHVSNVIAVLSGPRALAAYVRSLRGHPVVWDKTAHAGHPSIAPPNGAAGARGAVANGPSTACPVSATLAGSAA